MNAREFASRRARIEWRAAGRGKKYQRELAHLVRDARAALMVIDRKVVGYRLPNGQMVCIKRRYRDEEQATRELAHITERPGHVPTRCYPCTFCGGWHLTSQARNSA